MSRIPQLAQTPPTPDDHPLARARRHHRLLVHELVARAGVAIIILVLTEVANGMGFTVNPIIRVAALGGLLVNGPWLLISRTGRGRRVLTYGRMLTDIGLLTFGLYGAGGPAAAPYLGVYTLVSLYSGFMFSSLACVVATTAATLAYLSVVLIQHAGWIPAVGESQ